MQGSETKNLTITPAKIKLPTGKRAEYKCSVNTNLPVFLNVYWVHPNGTRLSSLNDSRFQLDENGTLSISNTQVDDSGSYMCVTKGGAFNESAILEIYEMPTYFLEGMIILIINGVLLFIFLVCLIINHIATKRMERGQFKRFEKSMPA